MLFFYFSPTIQYHQPQCKPSLVSQKENLFLKSSAVHEDKIPTAEVSQQKLSVAW